jgi:hypothetical protein
MQQLKLLGNLRMLALIFFPVASDQKHMQSRWPEKWGDSQRIEWTTESLANHLFWKSGRANYNGRKFLGFAAYSKYVHGTQWLPDLGHCNPKRASRLYGWGSGCTWPWI